MKKRKIYRKAILLLPLALVLALQVNAKTIYSEYELIGTTEEYKEDTELIKYTPVVMHKFYTSKKTNEVFMPHYYKSEKAPYKESFVYGRTRTLSNEKDPLAITYKRIAFKCIDCQNVTINKIEIINNDLPEEPIETHILVYNADIKTYEKSAKLSDDINIQFKNGYMIFDPRVVIEFDKDINLSLKIKYMNDNEVLYEQDLEPDNYPFGEKLVLEVKMESDYERYMIDRGLLTLEEVQNSNYHKYYTNEVLTYKFYNLEKEYYKDSRETSLDGYEYDEEEDYIVYDIYERTILEKTEDKENLQETEDSSTEKTEEDKPPKEEVIEKEPEKPSSQPEESIVKPEKPVEQPEETTEPEETETKPENSKEEEDKSSIEETKEEESFQKTEDIFIEETEEKEDIPVKEEIIEKEPEKPLSKPEETTEPEETEIKPETLGNKEDKPSLNETGQITPTLSKDETEDLKLEISLTPDKNQSIITEEKESEKKKNELPSNIKTEQDSIIENNKIETVRDIVYVLENNTTSETDLNEENEKESKIETEPLVNDIGEINRKKSATTTSLALKIMLRIIISILVLLIIRKIFRKVSANNAK